MSESERRRKYRYNRVLIESERILDPQFHDAVVFLSGAQVEMLRNVTQYLNRQDTYAAEQFLGYYLTPTDADYDDILEIVADLEETLMGNPNTIWGYADRWYQHKTANSTGEAYTDVYSDAVPAGYVYVVEKWALLHYAGTTCATTLRLNTNAEYMPSYYAPAQPSGQYEIQATNITLKEDDAMHLRVFSLPDTEVMHLWIWGHMMLVPE